MARQRDQPAVRAGSVRHRAGLVDAARAVFEARGYVDTSVSDIVREAGGSRASFYSYFTSKDDVLAEIVAEMIDGLFAATTRPVAPERTSFEALEANIEQFLHAYRDRVSMLRVLDQATLTNERFVVMRLDIRARFTNSIEAAVAAHRRHHPDPDGLDPHTTAIALGGMVEELARGRYLFGQEFDEQRAVHTLAVLWARCLGIPTQS